MKAKISVEKILLLLLGIITFITTSWTLKNDFYFMFDDIAWIHEVKYSFDIRDFTFLPQSRYNDRPLRTIWFWALYHIFGMNYTAYYLVTLLWHVLNTYLVFALIKRILIIIQDQEEENIFQKSLIVASIFGLYPKHLMAVCWLSGAANDLICTFFSLLTMYCYLNYMKKRKSYINIFLAFVFYVAAMRSKEAAICLPIIIMMFEVYIAVFKNDKNKFHYGYFILLAYMCTYLIRLFTLPIGLTAEGQYKQDFNIITIIRVFANYVRLYFGVDDSAFSYSLGTYYTKVGNIGIVISLLIIFYIILNLIKKRNVQKYCGYLAFGVAVGLSMAPLLVLPNIQHLLYFYFPAVFLSIFFGLVIYDAWEKVNIIYSKQMLVIIVFCSLILLNNVGGAKKFKEYYIHLGEEALSTVNDIENIDILPQNTHLYLDGISDTANVFNYSPGYIVNILYDDPSIVSEIYNSQAECIAPYAIWKYSNGHVIEVERKIE